MIVRTALHSAGFRYRLHDKRLPGKPDLVFPKYGAVLFVHGCFWHGHNCHLFRFPATRADFWRNKITENIRRDRQSVDQLKNAGWRVGIVWECALKGKTRLAVEDVLRAHVSWLQTGTGDLEITGQEA